MSCLPLATGLAADWPQFRGARFDGTSTDRLNKDWSGSVTNALWLVPLTNGLGSLAVSGGRVFTLARRAVAGVSREICVALNATNGAELWATVVDDADYPHGGVGYDDGPRSTPAVDGDSVYVLSSYLKLHRLHAATGTNLWQVDLQAQYSGNVIAWQSAASPVIENGLIHLNANCVFDTLMALRTSDGSVAWRTEDEGTTHATPALTTIHGMRQVIHATQSGLVSLEPASGQLLWRQAYLFFYGTSLGASPVVFEDIVFITGAHAYGMGSMAVQVTLTNGAWTTRQLWWTNNPASHWMTPVVHQGFLYGLFGIQTFDTVNAQLKCIDLRTGSVKWSANGYGRGASLRVDDHLITLTERGQLVLSRPATNAHVELARFQAIPGYSDPTNKCWNMPAVANGRVYVRSTAFVAAFNLGIPSFRFDPPQVLPPDGVRLTARMSDGSDVPLGRAKQIDFRMGTNLSQAVISWARLTNAVLTNGVLRLDQPRLGPARYFILSEPN